MFEGIINSLLEKYLAPYLENMSSTNLRFRLGKMSAKNLKLKSHLCALLGFSELELQVGELKVLDIEVPFLALFSGDISIKVQNLEVHAIVQKSTSKSAKERLAELRQTRLDAVEHKAAQQIEVRKHQKVVEAAKQEGKDIDAGMVAKVARHFISNVKIEMSELSCRVSDPESGAHVAVDLGELFAQAPTEEEVLKATTTQTDVEVSRSTSNFDVDGARFTKAIGFNNFYVKGGYKVSSNMISLHRLQLVLLAGPGKMQAEIDFGLPEGRDGRPKPPDEVTLTGEQITACIMLSNALGEESKRLHALLMPPGAERMVNLHTKEGIKKADREYVALSTRYYRKELLEVVSHKRLQELEESEQWRLQVMRDVVPLPMQAEWFMPVMEELQEARKRDAKKEASWHNKMLQKCSCWSEDTMQKDPQRMMKELHEEAEGLKDVIVPNDFSLELQIGKLILELYDQEDQLLQVTLNTAGLVANVSQKVDHRGEQSADWDFSFVLQSFSIGINHQYDNMLRFGTANDKPAFRVNLDNRLEETKNVIAVSLSMQPLELFFHDSLIRSLRKLQTDIIRATKQEPSQEEIKPNAKMQDIVQQKKTEEEEEVLQSYYAMGKAWMETSAGKDMLEEAKKRTPDELELSVELQAPRIYFPVLGKAAVHISLGVLTAESKKPFTMESGELTVQLHPAEREPLLAVLTRQGVKHPMIASRPLITTLAFDDSCARVVVQLESMEIKASPDLIQILATIPKVLQEAMKIEEEVEVLEEEVEELQVVPKPKAKPAIQAPVEKAHEDSPSRRIYQFLLDVQNIGIMLDSDIDRSAPVLRVFAALRSVEVCQHGRQIHMPLETFALSAGGPCKQMMRVKADGFNLEVGRFEPLLETFELGCQLVKDDITGTEVHVFGRKPLLLNVNPVILRRLQWYSRRLAGSVVPMPDEPKPVPVRYALLNLSGVPVGLHLKLKDIAADAWMDVPPTGQTWRCLDNLDFTFPPSVGVAVAEPHVPASRRQIARLDLGLLNCIRIPNSQLIVQLRRPSVLGAVVLISSKVLIFNETSIPLALRFDGSKPLVWTSCASSDLLDGTADFYESQVRDGCTPGAVPSWLMPGGLASVPLDLPQPKDDDDDDDDEEDEDEGATSWEMMMQTEPNMWGKASFSFNSTYASVQCGSQHLLAVVDYETLAPPASEKLMNVKLLPPLQLTSCLPCKVEVQYHSLGEAVESSRQVEIAETDTVRIYDIGFPQTVRIRARVIGGEWSEWGTLELNEEDIGEEDRRLSRLEAEMQVDTPGFGEYTFALLDKGNGKVQLCCQTWLIDRTGWNLSVEREGPLIDAGDGVLLCGNNVKYHKISSNGRCGPEFSLPSGQNDWTITTTHEGTNVTVRARPLPGQQDHTTRCLEIVPRHIVQNLTEHPVEFRSGDCRVVVQPMDMESPKFTSENLQFRPSTASAWSVDIPAIEESAGTASIAVGRFCWTVDIRADHGTIYVSIKPGSKYALWNRLPKGECEIRVRSLQFRALAGEVVDFAWVDPFFKDKDLEAELILEEEDFTINPRTMYQKKLRGRLELFSSFENSTTFLEVREKQSYEQPIAAMTLNLVLPRIGVSLMGRSPHRVRISELLYLELALLQVVASTKPKQDMQVLNFALGDLQLDYQVPENPLQHCVVIGNRGVSSHTLARSFLQFHLERHQISSSEMHLACVSFKLDDMEVTVDDTLITTMLNVLDILVPAPTKTQAGFPLDSVQQVRKQAGASIVPTLDKIPAAEPIFQIDELMMSSISVKIWSRIRLKRVKSFLPSWACGLVGALSLSNSMSMDGAEISLSAKSLKNMHGKAADLASGFVREWMGNMLKSVASCLGHSSLLAIPKAPMELLESAGGYAAQFVPDADLDHMVDPDYAHHHKLQRQQPIRGASQGMHSAVSSFGQGLSGMMDIFRRPVEGAKQDGVKGFVKGVGTGLVSGVVKGVTGIKDAAMDFGRGLVAEAHRTFNPTQVVKKRVRHPRATFGPIGAIIDYSELDAHVIAYIHSKVDPRCAVEAVVPLFKWKDQKPQDQQDNDKVHESSDEDHPETAPMGPSFEALVVTKDEILLAEIPNQRLHEVKSFYPDLGYEMSGKNMVHSRILQHLRAVDRPAGSKSSFQIRHAIPFSSLISAKWAESKQEEKEQKPPLQLEIRAQQANGQFGHMSISQQRSLRPYTLDLPMPWGVCQELPQSLKSLLSSYDCGLPPKQVEILHLTLSTLRRAMQGDELENKTVVVEECWEVQRAAIAAGFESGWQLPFLPNEPEQQNGWVAEGLQRRHPLLDPNRNAARKKKGPPIRQLRFWKPNGTWQREINSDTDAEGWQYATGWSSRDWRAAPRIMLDVVRRRKWTLQYTLNFLGQMSSPSLPAPKLPVSMAPSLAPSVTESVPPSADVSAFPSAAASPTRTKRRPEQPESSASAKPGPISARQLHDIAAAAARRQWTTTRRLPLPRPSSIASPSSAQSPSFARPQSAASSSYRQSTQAVGQSHGGQLQSSLHVPRVGHAGHVQPTAATTAVVQTGSFPLTRVPQMRDPLLASFSSTTSRVSTATASRPQYRVVVNQR